MRTRMKAAAVAGLAALAASTGVVPGGSPAAAGTNCSAGYQCVFTYQPGGSKDSSADSARALAASVVAAVPEPRADPYCNHIDDSARPVIREGASSPRGAVAQVQCLINAYSNQSIPLPVDGIPGPRTRVAIRSVQHCNQVSEPVGVIVGRPTWDVLYHPIPSCARPRSA